MFALNDDDDRTVSDDESDYEAMITEFAGDPARGVTPALSEEDEERLAHEAKFVSKEVIDARVKAGLLFDRSHAKNQSTVAIDGLTISCRRERASAPPSVKSEGAVAATLATHGLCLLELRALWAAVADVAFVADDDGRKAEWRERMAQKLREMAERDARGELSAAERVHPAYEAHEAMARPDAAPLFLHGPRPPAPAAEPVDPDRGAIPWRSWAVQIERSGSATVG